MKKKTKNMNKLKTKIYDQISDYKRLKLIKMV